MAHRSGVSLRTRIFISCVACLLLATLMQFMLFGLTSSSIIARQTEEINQNTLDNLSIDVYETFKEVENSLINIYSHRDFVRELAAGREGLSERFGSIAYEMANMEFDARENLVALYI